jgi:hypothetical protein
MTDALLHLTDESPKFVAIHVAYSYLHTFGGHDALALLAGENQEFQNGRVVNLGDALHTRNAVASSRSFIFAFSMDRYMLASGFSTALRPRGDCPSRCF